MFDLAPHPQAGEPARSEGIREGGEDESAKEHEGRKPAAEDGGTPQRAGETQSRGDPRAICCARASPGCSDGPAGHNAAAPQARLRFASASEALRINLFLSCNSGIGTSFSFVQHLPLEAALQPWENHGKPQQSMGKPPEIM